VSLTGQVLVVTGGSRGIGRAIVLDAARQGARVVFCSRSVGVEGLEVQVEGEAFGAGSVVAVAADVSTEHGVDHLFDTARERFGRVDAVVSSAAVSREDLLVTMDLEDWDAVVATNLTGSFLVARRALREFLPQSGGRLVSVGTLSQHGAPGNTSYAASKGGVLGLTRTIARQYGRQGIRANLVVTGYVETSLSAQLPDFAKKALVDCCPLRRPGTPDEIAAAVLFLASERARGLNGQAVFASGGLMEVPL